MSPDKYWLYTRQDIADYLRISRMTLSRWEKLVPLHDQKGVHIRDIRRTDADEWQIKVHTHPKYRQPFKRWTEHVTPRRRDVTCSRSPRYSRE